MMLVLIICIYVYVYHMLYAYMHVGASTNEGPPPASWLRPSASWLRPQRLRESATCLFTILYMTGLKPTLPGEPSAVVRQITGQNTAAPVLLAWPSLCKSELPLLKLES